MDGCWDFAGSGHVDENETARQAVARECLEELGITVNPADMEFVHLCHRVAGGDGRTYYADMCFVIRKYQGESPPSWSQRKTPGSGWFPTEALPENTSTAVGRSCQRPVCGASLTVRSFMTFRSHQSKKRKSLCLFKR
ncbi:MAG: NUDIX domain-containing protein [Dysosmobacter sp.]